MMHKAADAVANWLVKTEAISAEDFALYSYAMYSVMFVSIPLFLSVVVGILMNMPLESLLFIAPFVLIRKFSGGFHLKSPTVCLFVSTGIIAAFLFGIKLVLLHEVYFVPLVCMFILGILLFIKSPIDTEERKLSERETVVFGKIARIMVVAFWVAVMTLIWFQKYSVAIPISFGIILSGALQVPCCFTNRKR